MDESKEGVIRWGFSVVKSFEVEVCLGYREENSEDSSLVLVGVLW